MPIITGYEILRSCTALKKEFPIQSVNIEVEEKTIFLDCFTLDFYNRLLTDLADHESATNWIEGIAYALNAKVIFEGCVFISQIANNTDFPNNSTNWKEAEKFNTSEYNSLYGTGMLQKFLAYEIVKNSGLLGFRNQEYVNRQSKKIFNILCRYIKKKEIDIH